MRFVIILVMCLVGTLYPAMAQPSGTPASQQVLRDEMGDPLPPRASARFGTVRLRHGDRVECVAFSPDGKILASAGMDNNVRLWDVKTGEEKRRHIGHGLGFRSLAFSPDGRYLAASCGSADCRIYLWDAATGKEFRQLRGLMDAHSLAFSHDSKLLAWGTLGGEVFLWNVNGKEKVRRLHRQFDAIHAVCFSPDSRLLAAGGMDRRVTLCDAKTGKSQGSMVHCAERSGSVDCIAFTPNGKILISGGGLYEPIRIWDRQSKKLLRELKWDGQLVRAIAISPNGETLAAEITEGVVGFWDIGSGKQIRKFPVHGGHCYSLAFSPDGKLLAFGGTNHVVSIWDCATGKEMIPLPGHRAAVMKVAYTPDGESCFSATGEDTIRIWDAKTGKEKQRIECGKASPDFIAGHPKGKTFLWAGSDRNRPETVHLCDLATRKELRKWKGHKGWTGTAAISPDARWLASRGKTMAVWDLNEDKITTLFKGELNTNGANTVLFLPDGKRLVSGHNDNTIRVWDLSKKKELRRLVGHTDWVSALACTKDGKTLASSSDGIDPVIRLWNPDDGRQIGQLQKGEKGTWAIALSPDGKILASSVGYYGSIRIWNVEKRKVIEELKGHSGLVYSLAFAPDGASLVSASGDTSILVWKLKR